MSGITVETTTGPKATAQITLSIAITPESNYVVEPLASPWTLLQVGGKGDARPNGLVLQAKPCKHRR